MNALDPSRNGLHRPRPPQLVWWWVIGHLCLAVAAEEGGLAFPGLREPRPQAGSSEYIVDAWDVGDGLPRHGVFAIAQTQDGFLWLGTDSGVVRFDGDRFKLLSPQNTPGMAGGRITALLADRQDRLWIGSHLEGACFYRDGHCTPVTSLRLENEINSFAEGKDGRIWVGTGRGLHFIEGGEIQTPPKAAGYPDGVTYKVAVDPLNGRIYCCHWENVGRWEEGRFHPLTEAGGAGPLLSNNFIVRRAGGIWFLDADKARYGALRRLLPDDRVTPPQALPFPVPRWGIGDFLEDRAGNLWVAVNGQGLFRLGADGFHERFALGNGDVEALFEDRQGIVWAGTATAGLFRLKRRLFHVFPDPAPGPAATVCEDRRGGVVFTTRKGDVFRVQGRQLTKLPLSASFGLFVDERETYWAGQPGILRQYHPAGDGFVPGAAFGDPPFHGANVFLQRRSGEVWFGSALGGLGRLNGSSAQAVGAYQAIYVRALAEGRDGALWTGSFRAGLQRLSEGKVQDFGPPEPPPRAPVSALFMAGDETLWIGTLGGGLGRLRDGRFTWFTTREGLPSDEVCSLIGLDDALWLGTTKGVGRISWEELDALAEGRQRSLRCRVFGTQEGMASAECVSGVQPGACRSADGRLWFATLAGVAVVDPRAVAAVDPPPTMEIEEVLADDVGLLVTDAASAPAGTARIEVRYTGVDLAAASRVRFQYRLAGHDDGWIDAGNQRAAFFTRVPPGSYRFMVRAANQAGAWSDPPQSLGLIIRPHYWQTAWFRAGAASVIAGLVAAGIWLAARRSFRRRLEAAERARAVELERSRIARDLHDQLGAQVTQITFQTQLLAAGLPAGRDGRARQQVEDIRRAATQLVQGMDEVVWATDPGRDNLESTVAFITSHAQEFFRATPVRLRLDVPLEVNRAPLAADIRHQLFLAAREALTNVLKHAGAGEVCLRLRVAEGWLNVIIEDDGRGLPAAEPQREGDGLRNMRQRLRSVGGSADIQPREAGGTRVRLAVRLTGKTGSHEHATVAQAARGSD